jgi:uncharacterized membrane protein YfhO
MSARAVLNSTAASWSNSSPGVRSLFVVIAGALLIAVPFLVFGVPSNRDLTNHFRFTLPFYDSIAAGNLYPSWLSESNSGYGDASFRFYPPGLYYLLSAFRLVVGEWYVATLLTFATITVISCLGVYFWAKPILSERTAVCVALFYAIAPYHVNQLYQATLLAEWAGSAVLPFVFAFTDRVCAHGRRRDVAGLAASFAVLVLTHLPLTVIGAIAVLVYALVRIERGRWIESVVKLGAGAVLGLSASAVYWVTMVSELRWIGINDVHYDASVDFRRNFVLSTFSPDNLNVWWMNIIGLATLLLFVPAFLLLRRDSTNRGRSLRAVAILTLLAVFMSLPLSRPIWSVLSPLQQTQFPWRWFAILSMAGSVLAAAALPLVFRLKREYRILVFGAMAISAGFTLSHIVREAQYLNRPKFETALQDVRGTHSVDYWLPVWASQKPRAMSANVEAPGRQVWVWWWGSETRRFAVSAGEPVEARVRTFYYPHWTATTNGQPLSTRPDNDGALLVSLPSNTTQVELSFVEPQRSRLSSAVSLAGFLLIGGLLVPFSRRKR